MVDAVTEALQLIADIDADYLHAVHDPLNPRHRDAKRCYQDLLNYACNELNRSGAKDYPLTAPPPLRETRPGYRST